jgi:hypothetical protein
MVVKLVPVPSEVHPVDAEYQLIVPDDAVAPSDTVPLPHLGSRHGPCNDEEVNLQLIIRRNSSTGIVPFTVGYLQSHQ